MHQSLQGRILHSIKYMKPDNLNSMHLYAVLEYHNLSISQTEFDIAILRPHQTNHPSHQYQTTSHNIPPQDLVDDLQRNK